MPRYVVLMNWTDQGVRTVKETVDRYEAARPEFEAMGAQIREVYWTAGPYDLVTIADAPDGETLSAVLLKLAGAGNLRTTSMRAFDPDEMRGVIEKIS